jgi:plasmid stabilization system protein ParE
VKIIWSDDAIKDYHQNIEYLLENWTQQVAIEFIENVDAIIELIKLQPELYPASGYKDVRRAVIRKQISLFSNPQVILLY